MPKLTKGTHLYFIDPANDQAVRLTKVSAISPGGSPKEQVDITDLEEEDARQFLMNLQTPGQGSLTVMADPSEASHIRLHEIFSDPDIVEPLHWAVGWSDGNAAPTVDSNGTFNFATTRTFYSFDAHIADFPFDFQLSAVVQTTIALQRTGRGYWSKKV